MLYKQALFLGNLKNRKLCAGTQKPPVDGPKYKKNRSSGRFFYIIKFYFFQKTRQKLAYVQFL
jgi:hypothetical protein